MKKEKNVLVTGIGGNVGYGILKNLKNLKYKLNIIGTDISSTTAGQYYCTKTYQVPYAYENNYIDSIIAICKKEEIHLIIPSTDFETYYLSLNKKNLPTVATSSPETCKIFLDKYLTYQCFYKNNLPFAETMLPSEYDFRFSQIIVKPKEGRGSRNLFIDPENPKLFDDGFIVQKRYNGLELTTAFYITKKREVLGQITLSRKLENGTTMFCQVNHEYDQKIETIIESLNRKIPIVGSCNIQMIATENKQLFPFEVNGRLSGTNSIRSQFGFHDVKYTIQEYLYNKNPSKPKTTNGFAIRILSDIIYLDKNKKPYIY